MRNYLLGLFLRKHITRIEVQRPEARLKLVMHGKMIWQDFSGQLITQLFGTFAHSPKGYDSR